MNDDRSALTEHAGDSTSLADWIKKYRPSLRAMVELRMDHRLRSRIDPSDILQETFIEAADRIHEQPKSNLSPRMWLRFLTRQQLMIAWRRHAVAKSRDVTREQRSDSLQVSGEALLQAIVQSGTSPSDMLMREEKVLQLKAGLDALEDIDREVLVMRHFEQLTLQETAECLNITVAATSKRYYRALQRIAILMHQQESAAD